MKLIPSIVVPIIDNNEIKNKNLYDLFLGKNIILFGVPGAFTPTCSEKHLPGFIKLNYEIKKKGFDHIFCLSVNDPFVMNSWLSTYEDGKEIKGIADGNSEISKFLKLDIDKSSDFMSTRCKRFAMVIKNNQIIKEIIEKPGEFKDSSAENILKNLQ